MTPGGKTAKKPAGRPRPAPAPTEGEGAILAAIAKMSEPDRSMGARLHEIIRANAPNLAPRTWYGFPAYSKEGNVVLFFRGRERFKERYMTLGFNDGANLDEGHLWPVYYALTGLTAAEEAKVASLVKRAVS